MLNSLYIVIQAEQAVFIYLGSAVLVCVCKATKKKAINLKEKKTEAHGKVC